MGWSAGSRVSTSRSTGNNLPDVTLQLAVQNRFCIHILPLCDRKKKKKKKKKKKRRSVTYMFHTRVVIQLLS